MASLTKRDYRVIMYYNFKRGLNKQECLDEMISVFGQEAPSVRTIERWYLQFKRGEFGLNDDPRPGRPFEVTVPETVARVEKAIREDRHITYRQLEKLLNIPVATLHKIVTEHLHVKKLCTLWVPHSLNEQQQQRRVEWCKFMLKKFANGKSKDVVSIVTGDETWVYYYDVPTKTQSKIWVFDGEEQPTQPRKSKSVGKRMMAVFFNKQGLVKTVMLAGQKTVTSSWYTNTCLTQLFEELSNRRPNSRLSSWFLHHDNAPAHRAGATMNFLTAAGIKMLEHPPYSPDLAPCDFGLFPYVKTRMKGRKFSTEEQLIGAFEEELELIPKQKWEDWINDWFRRMVKCVNSEGRYFEKI